MRHGCLVLCFVAATAIAGTRGQEPIRASTRQVEVYYEINAPALPLASVELFFSVDNGQTWRSYGFDNDRRAPILFRAPQAGLFGLFLVVGNSSGPSSPPPNASTEPQVWLFVDDSAPVVQLHDVRLARDSGYATLQVRWTAVDAHLLPRPVELQFQRPPEPQWHPVTSGPIGNTGRFDWRLPDELVGPIAVRLVVSDEGGNRTESPAYKLDIPASQFTAVGFASSPSPAGASVRPNHGNASRAEDLFSPQAPSPVSSSPPASVKREPLGTIGPKERASRLFAEGIALRDAGLDREAVARLRETVRLDPQRTDALSEMGTMLHRLGDLDRALAAFEAALAQQPNLRTALRGAALVEQNKKQYKAAADRLRVILRYNPADAEIWMRLGDLAVFQGDEMLARECFTRATQIDPQARDVVAEAQKRLALMSAASASGRNGG